MSVRAEALASRLEEGARRLAAFAMDLTEVEWQARVPGDGRKVGVVVHHVAHLYPLQLHLAEILAAGQAIRGVGWDAVDQVNAEHAKEHDAVTKREALDLLARNSVAAAAAIRGFSDEELDRAATVSLYGGAPVTCQFMLEDHAIRHSYHHLVRLDAALNEQLSAA